MAAYYNEIDAYAAEWLRNLIKAGHIADGEVDTRSIVDVEPDDLRRFDQCHFFAGIAGWSRALRLAGWEDERQIWTGSCPCQPFSVAGQGKGVNDERHLWPHFFRLIRGCRPSVVMGEQVAGAAGYGWLDGVRSDLESENYAIEGVDIPACSVNAPHIRSRLYWVANANSGGCVEAGERGSLDTIHPGELHNRMSAAERDPCGIDMADTPISGWRQGVENAGRVFEGNRTKGKAGRSAKHGDAFDMADADKSRPLEPINNAISSKGMGTSQFERNRGFWNDAIWLNGADGKTRRVKSNVCLLVDGISNCLANVLSICEVASKRITDHAERSQTDPGEVLRMVREHLYEKAGGEKQPTGVCGKLYAPQVLFDFMLSQAAARNGATDSSSIKKAGKETVAGAMHIMRMDGGFVHSSCQRQSNGQQRIQSSDPLHELSFLLACNTQAFGEAVFDAHAAINRVGMLRAYGNAIVPELAKEVIKAFMES